MRSTLAAVVWTILLIPGSAGAAGRSSGVPLLDVHSLVVYDSGTPPDRAFLAKDWTVTTLGVVGSNVRYGVLDNGAPNVLSRLTKAPPLRFKELTRALENNAVGTLVGNCTIAPPGVTWTHHLELTWYGKGGHQHHLVTDTSFPTPCDQPTRTLLNWVFDFEAHVLDPDL